MKLRLILIMAGLLAVFSARAKNPVTLRECIDYAMEHNLTIRENNLTVEEKKTDHTRKLMSLFPTISLYGSGNLNWGRSVDMQELVIIKNKLTESASLSLGAEWTVFDGLSGFFSKKAARYEIDAALLDNDRLKNEISLNITEAYLQLILSEELSKVAYYNYRKMLSERERIASLVEEGQQPRSALYNIEAQCAGELARLTGCRCDNKRNIMKLAQLLNLPYDGSFKAEYPLDGEETPPPPSSTIEEIELYAERMPDILSMKSIVESKRNLFSAAKGSAAPTITLSGAYSSYYSSTAEGKFGAQLRGNVNPSVGVSIEVPLFDGYYSAAAIKNGRMEYERARLQVEERRQDMVATIQSAFIEADNLYQMMLSAKKKMDAAEKLLDASLVKFDLGGITAVEYTVTRTDFLTAQSEYIRSKWQYVFQLKIIDYYKGNPIEL